jgi:hypothetical protein
MHGHRVRGWDKCPIKERQNAILCKITSNNDREGKKMKKYFKERAAREKLEN